MANYTSPLAIFQASTTNMKQLVLNTKYDNNYYSIPAPSFLGYSYIYASGNSWLGFGSTSEHLKVNRRDAAMYLLYSEEGTLRNKIKFFKITWGGYSYYSKTSSSYAIKYSVILWETGDISLYMETIPTSYNDETYQLSYKSTLSYTVNSSQRHITFKYNPTTQTFTLQNSIIEFTLDDLYLIKSDEKYYTYSIGSSNNIEYNEITEALTEDVFKDYGADFIPNTLFSNFNNPEILCLPLSDNIAPTKLSIEGIPNLPQVLLYDSFDFSLHNPINHIYVQSDNVTFQISIDDGTSWIYWDGVSWITASNYEGMNGEMINSMTSENWAEISQSSNCIFKAIFTDSNSSVDNIYIKYND